jgi:hypothetical protein
VRFLPNGLGNRYLELARQRGGGGHILTLLASINVK